MHCANSPGVAEEILRHPSFDSLSVTDSLGRSALHLLCRSEAIAEVLLSVEMPQEVLDLLETWEFSWRLVWFPLCVVFLCGLVSVVGPSMPRNCWLSSSC